MKLALVLYRYFPFGGLQGDMLAISKEALGRGHQVTVFCSQWQGARPEKLTVRLIAQRGWSNASRMVNFSRDLVSVLASEPFDLVVGFNKWPGLDFYYAADSCFAYKAWRERGWLYRATARARHYLAFEKVVFDEDSPTEILELSLRERERFRDFYHTPPARFHTLPPGICRDRIAPENWQEIRTVTRRELGFTEREKILLAVGSGFHTKGLARSVAILPFLSDCKVRLVVVGQDKKRSFLKLARQNKVEHRIRFLGGRDDVPALLQAADVLVHPAYRENTGNVLLEAMVAGLPVVATDVCGYAHYVTEAGMGQVIGSPYSAEEFVASIRRVLAESTEHWHQKGTVFAANDEIYQRPKTAVDILENRPGRA